MGGIRTIGGMITDSIGTIETTQTDGGKTDQYRNQKVITQKGDIHHMRGQT